MADFVLVHGAWHGAWCWRRVVERLTGLGHRAFAVNLTGVGDRAHLLSAQITLETHIADVLGVIEAEELARPVLAVHSYAGMLGTAVADRLPGRLAHLVYVDAGIPEPGDCWSSSHPADIRDARLAAIAASPLRTLAPPDARIFGLDGADRDWVNRRQTPHPGQPYTAPLQFDAARVAVTPRTFISCTRPTLATIDPTRAKLGDPSFWGGHWALGGRSVEMETGHDPMISAPDALTALLCECASA